MSIQERDAVVVGAGFAGLYMLVRLRELGLSAQAFDAGDDVGGTWFWNRYPGARCDVESLDYQYSFSPELLAEWRWSERYPRQPEILAYLRHVAERFDLRRDIALRTRVTAATFDEAAGRWDVHTDVGDHIRARFVVMATGCLSAARLPELPGLDDFAGRKLHTAHWPHEEVDFRGRRVGVIGTGSSGIQTIPVVAQQAAHLTVFQRTPNFSVPAINEPLDDAAVQAVLDDFPERRRRARESIGGLPYPENGRSALEVSHEEREQEYEARTRMGGLAMYGSFADLIVDPQANQTAVAFFHARIRDRVHDPAVAELLSPKSYPFGTKRVCVDTGYYETYNRDNVSIVDISQTPIERVTPDGLRVGGVEHELDDLVFATGFDAMTGALAAIDVRGRAGTPLGERWSAGPRTYLGLGVAGFPNLFLVTGPGSPSVLSNMIVSIEQHVDWIADAMAHLVDQELETIEALPEAEAAWVEHVNEVADSTLVSRANSWYLGANVPGKPRIYMPYLGGVGPYRQKCDEVAAAGYEGFALA